MRVITIESFKDGVLRTYGEGEYIGDKVPDVSPFNQISLKNPCIKLDSGKYVWGFQCWWGNLATFRENYKGHIKEEIVVDLEEMYFPVLDETSPKTSLE